MKKSLVLLAGASMAFLGLPAVSHAQAASGPFADVPTDHWAYQSVDTLQKAGIVIGYPDGTYGGRRPMTRYEFAVAIARLLAQMNKPTGNFATTDQLSALRSDLESRIAGNTDAITALRNLVNGFQPELTRLGQDVAAANARLDALEARVNALNHRLDNDEGILGSVVDEQRRFHVTGVVNLIARGDASRRTQNGSSTITQPFLDENGVNVGGGLAGKRLLASSDIYHDVLLHIRGKVADTTTANVDLDFGNYLSQVGNTAAFPGYSAGGLAPSALTPGSLTAANQYANVYKAYLDAAVKLGPLGGAELLVGRFGNQYTKYTLKQSDADIYTNLQQTDSGDIIGDGASLSFKAGPARVNAFAFKNSAIQFSELYGGTTSSATTTTIAGIPGNPFGPTPGTFTTIAGQTRPGGLIPSDHVARYDQAVGGRITLGAPEGAVIGATIEQFGLTNTVGGTTSAGVPLTGFDGVTDPNRTGSNAQYDRVSVLGVDFNGALPFGIPGVKKGGFLVDASYTATGRAYGTKFNNVANGFRYQAADAQGGFAIGGLNLKGGYQYVGPDFSAPGAWGRIGAWSNPTNVRGPVVSAKYAFTPKLSLDADAEFYKAAYGTDKLGNPVSNPLRQDDHVTHYQVGFKYGLSGANAIDLGYEDVRYDLRNKGGTLTAAGHPNESYVNIGLGHTVSNNASVKLLYQIVHYDDKGTGFDQNAAASGGKSDGGIAVGQFQLKF